jgi:large subunit ribosomal protein L5e
LASQQITEGACDGGLSIPHNEKRFPAYSKEEGFSAEELKARIFGNHVTDYMNYLLEEDEDRYKKQFSAYVAAGIEPDAIEDMYAAAHAAIRANPTHVKKAKSSAPHNKKWRLPKLTYAQRKENIVKKIAASASA